MVGLLVVVCGHCGYVLYEGNELKTLNEILREYAGVCPNCKKSLKPVTQSVKILEEEG